MHTYTVLCSCVPSLLLLASVLSPEREISEALVFWCGVIILLLLLFYHYELEANTEMKVFGYTYEAKESNMNLSVVPQSQCGHIIITTSKCSA